jgi:hypothetical protein
LYDLSSSKGSGQYVSNSQKLDERVASPTKGFSRLQQNRNGSCANSPSRRYVGSISEIHSYCGIHTFVGLGSLWTGIEGIKVVMDFKKVDNTVKKIWKSSILLLNID